MVEFLLERGADLRALQVAGFGRLERRKEFAEQDPSVLPEEKGWGTPLHAACI